MIEFVDQYGRKVSVNSKYIMTVQPKWQDPLHKITVITFVGGKFLEVAHSYNEVLKMIEGAE